MNGISERNPVRIFVVHAFQPAEDYDRVFEYLESSHNFYYKNCSNPGLHVTDKDAMKDELRKQISLSEIVVVPSGMYASHREIMDFAVHCAKGLNKPIVVLESFGVKQKIPVQLEALGDETIEWNEREIVDAIRRQARHENTARWDVIDFKMD